MLINLDPKNMAAADIDRIVHHIRHEGALKCVPYRGRESWVAVDPELWPGDFRAAFCMINAAASIVPTLQRAKPGALFVPARSPTLSGWIPSTGFADMPSLGGPIAHCKSLPLVLYKLAETCLPEVDFPAIVLDTPNNGNVIFNIYHPKP